MSGSVQSVRVSVTCRTPYTRHATETGRLLGVSPKIQSTSMRLGQTSVVYLLSKIAASALGFLGTIYLTRTLGGEIYGFYAITLALVGWLGLIKSVGFGQAIIKRMTEGDEPDAYLAAGTAIKTSLTLLVAVGVVVFRDPVNSYVGQPVAEFVVLLLVVTIFSDLVNAALQGSHRVHIYAPLSTVKQGARTLAMVGLVVVGFELSGMLIGHAVGTALVAVAGLWLVKPTLVFPRWQHVRELFDFAKYSWLGNVRSRAFSDLDILVLAFFVSAGLTGIYAVAYSLATFVSIFGNAIQTTLFPELSKRSASGDSEMVRTLTNDALAYSGLFLIPGTVGAALLGDRLLRVYGPGFEPGAAVLTILLAGLLIYTYTRQLLNTLNAIDRPDLAFRANAAFIAANLIGNVALVYAIGWVGAAIATALSALVGLVFGAYYTHRQIGLDVPAGEITRQAVVALFMGLVVYGGRVVGEATWTGVDDYNAVFAVGLVGLGAAVYVVALLTISKRFRHTVRDNLPFTVWGL